MDIFSSYKVKIKESNKCFDDTTVLYRKATNFFIHVCIKEWNVLSLFNTSKEQLSYIETQTISTKSHPNPKYNFSNKFYKFPSYLRRSAISTALGLVSSYKSNYANWLQNKKGNPPSKPIAGYTYPAMYKDNCYVRIDTNTAKLKVWRFNTWDWITIKLRHKDVSYIQKHCSKRKECVPTLQKKGKNWYLVFAFKETVKLNDTKVEDQIVIGVDLGVNNACVCSAMKSDGTVIGRHFLKLSKEKDCLRRSLNKIRKANKQGSKKCPRLWAKVKGINKHISVKTAQFIIDIAYYHKANIIVFEHLNRSGRNYNQRIHHWKSQEIQKLVTHKAHRNGVRIRHVCAWGTSKLAYDGSGVVKRHPNNYSLCTFSNGKIYHCDLSASYNIASRYFVKELLKSSSVKKKLGTEINNSLYTKRTTCTLSTLISLNAELRNSIS